MPIGSHAPTATGEPRTRRCRRRRRPAERIARFVRKNRNSPRSRRRPIDVDGAEAERGASGDDRDDRARDGCARGSAGDRDPRAGTHRAPGRGDLLGNGRDDGGRALGSRPPGLVGRRKSRCTGRRDDGRDLHDGLGTRSVRRLRLLRRTERRARRLVGRVPGHGVEPRVPCRGPDRHRARLGSDRGQRRAERGYRVVDGRGSRLRDAHPLGERQRTRGGNRGARSERGPVSAAAHQRGRRGRRAGRHGDDRLRNRFDPDADRLFGRRARRAARRRRDRGARGSRAHARRQRRRAPARSRDIAVRRRPRPPSRRWDPLVPALDDEPSRRSGHPGHRRQRARHQRTS